MANTEIKGIDANKTATIGVFLAISEISTMRPAEKATFMM